MYLNNDEEQNICPICRDELNTKEIYSIPECNHKFHSSCILQWFRTGKNFCPCCKSESNYECSLKNKYSTIVNYSKKKDANIDLKKMVSYIQNINFKISNIKMEIKEKENSVGLYKEINADIMKLKRKLYKLQDTLYIKKRNLLSSVNVVPYIIGT